MAVPGLSPASVIALIALILGLSGSALALPGAGTVDGNDLQDGVVRARHIAVGAVGAGRIAADAVATRHVRAGAITSEQIADGQVTTADLAAPEPFHRVGAAGEPQFEDGGEGDCVWDNIDPAAVAGLNPAAYYKDALGIVRLAGIVRDDDGPGGDGTCEPGAGDEDDAVIFILPPGYRPENTEIPGSGGGVIVAPDEGATINGLTYPPGAVALFVDAGTDVTLDGITFRAEGPGTDPIDNPGARSTPTVPGESGVGRLRFRK